MQKLKCSIQSQALFGGLCWEWQVLEPEDWHRLRIPTHLADQVFRILFTHLPAVRLFEIRVSEQCPKEAYTHLARGVAALGHTHAVVNVVHGRSPDAHLIFSRGKGPVRHMDLNFAQMSRLDRHVRDRLQRPTLDSLEALFRLLDGCAMSRSLFKTLKTQLTRIPCKAEDGYHGLVDLVLKLVFLIFVQRKGWLNFDPYYMESKMVHCHGRGLSILHCFLKPLFARLEGSRVREPIDLGDLPRLGGGLFSFRPEQLPTIDNEWCLTLFETLISQYSFSLFEAREGRDVVGISPEILGHVFENLLNAEDRKAQGTFYTPAALAEKQVSASMDPWLRHARADRGKPGFKRRLSRIKVLDPSCGSGTYLLAAFQVLLKLRLSAEPERERYNGKLYLLKRRIMLENLYGLDISPMAVRLTEVRLWLNMIQDLEVPEPSKAPALPSLQHHIRPGDFLGQYLPERYDAIEAWPKYRQLVKLRRKFPTSPSTGRRALLQHIVRLERELQSYLLERALEGKRLDIRARLAQQTLPGHEREIGTAGTRWPREVSPQLHVIFSETMLGGGFDLIVGNPPWVCATKLPAPQKRKIRDHLPLPRGVVLKGQTDLSLYFFFAALALLKPSGQLGFLLPGKVLQSQYAASWRRHIAGSCRVDYLFDYGLDQRLVFHADTFPLAVGITKAVPEPDHELLVERHGEGLDQSFQVAQQSLSTGTGLWRIGSPLQAAIAAKTKDWPLLKACPYRIQRGIVTHAKRHFVFENKPSWLPEHRVRRLLRGRDIQRDRAAPAAWIYWPFDDGPDWLEKTGGPERKWLSRTGQVTVRGRRGRLRYGPKKIGPWVLVWKYLAREWLVALVCSGNWVPDQTTYFINFPKFEIAYRYWVYFRSDFASRYLRDIAERGKDRSFFFYAHTCGELPLPPDLMERVMAIPNPSEVTVPGSAQSMPDLPMG